MYSGAGALIAGNGLKAGVRFMTFDSVKALFKDSEVSPRSNRLFILTGSQGKLSSSRTVLAGLAAGVVEACVAVTPSETIK